MVQDPNSGFFAALSMTARNEQRKTGKDKDNSKSNSKSQCGDLSTARYALRSR